ncbi:endonuclease IV [archaeon]|nr:endonuclease IV [archaeon]
MNNRKVGINWVNVKELNCHGTVDIEDVDVVEISLADFDFLKFGEDIVNFALTIKENYDINYTVHAPYQNSYIEKTRVNLSKIDERNIKLMEETIKLSSEIGAETVVVHAGDAISRGAEENAVENLKTVCGIASYYGMDIALENIFTDENGAKRVGETPQELLDICDRVSKDNMGVNFDVGHAFISSTRYNLKIEDYFNTLRNHIIHMHIHNNHGIEKTPWDEHLPLFAGLIDYRELEYLIRGRNIILEIRAGSTDDISASLEFIKGKKRLEPLASVA